jgi:hypothetical protein
MSQEIRFGHNIFGYTTLVCEGDTFVALNGDGEQELRVGMTVVLLGDSHGYVPSGFSPGNEVTIVGFTEPFKNGESDHIVKVGNKSWQGWVKPSNIQRNISAPMAASTASDKRHQQLRKRVHPAAADLLDSVYLAMSEQERLSLPDDIGLYVDHLVAHALGRLSEFGEVLAEAIARVHAESAGGERFISDPVRSTSISRAILFIDPDGELVSVKNPEIVWDTSIPTAQVLKRYESYEVLTGPLRERRFSWRANALGDLAYRRGVVSRVEPISRARPEHVKVFLCHSSGDKAAVRRLHSQLREDGLEPWLDELDLRPGMEWRLEIESAVRQADVVLVCLSKSSISKTGFVQKEIAFALDAADERPEGHIYIVPARLEACDVPKRLSRWQWVDLFEPGGYARLVKALTVPDRDQANSQ